MNIINQLSEEDRNLITNLLIKNKTERELSTLMGVSQPAIHKRKKRIIENITLHMRNAIKLFIQTV